MSSEVIVDTGYGKLRGQYIDGVLTFRGVPFAAPPCDELRFRAPQPLTPWAGVRDATRFAPAAPQGPDPLPIAGESDAAGISEDCLTLNIWTPRRDGRRPVMVWIHGGSFQRGSASIRVLDGAKLARRGDVVVVAVQYRLSTLGFLCLPSMGADPQRWPSNLGLRDQIAALQWVHDEIAAFGGDPDNITLFGQSAGSISIGALLATQSASGLFKRAILQSGPPDAIMPEQAMPVTEALLRHLNLSAAEVERLRDVPLTTLLAAESACVAAPGERPLGMTFAPVIDGDLLPRHPMDLIRDGAAKNIQILVGTNADEMTPFLFIDPTISTLDDPALLERCTRIMPREAAPAAVTTYREARAERSERIDPPALWLALKGDRYARHPSMRVAELLRSHQGESYAYFFNWQSPFMGGMLGACHGLELPFVFGNLDLPVINDLTGGGPAATQLSELIQDAWIAFARGDGPGHSGLGSWPAYDSARRATMQLGADCSIVDAPMEAERRFWDTIASGVGRSA